MTAFKYSIPSKTPEYAAWVHMRIRCTDPNHKQWKDYGGRGIDVFTPWLTDFDAFYAHIGPRPSNLHTLDRVDNNQGYRPGNVRWATRMEQSNNLRRNILVENPETGERKTVRQWLIALDSPVSFLVAVARIRLGWDFKQAFTRPKMPRGHQRKRVFTVDGVTDTIPKLAALHGKTASLVNQRLWYDWNIEDALKTPVRPLNRKK